MTIPFLILSPFSFIRLWLIIPAIPHMTMLSFLNCSAAVLLAAAEMPILVCMYCYGSALNRQAAVEDAYACIFNNSNYKKDAMQLT
jgi:hypothetical protein